MLDADGVVQLPRPAWRSSLEALCPHPDRADAFLADVFAAEVPCLIGTADFEQALLRVLRTWQSTTPIADALRIWTEVDSADEVLHLVAQLRHDGVTVALASNQQAYRAGFMTSALGYAAHFDHLLYSCELGHAKPSPAYFSAALARIMIDPEQVLFIDDHEPHVAAARARGLQAEVFHVTHGIERLHQILSTYGLDVGRAASAPEG